jgi:Matrixin
VRTLLLVLLTGCSCLSAETFSYWIEPCTKPDSECEAADEQLAEWALEAWERVSAGNLTFVKSPLSKARIRLYWASHGNKGLYGEARSIVVDGKPGAEVDIRPNLHALGHNVEGVGSRDRLFRHSIVYLTCLHEIGHALGMPHTRSFADIMYSFEYGGNILEYFGRYRRKLSTLDDIRHIHGLSPEDERRLLAIWNKQSKKNGTGYPGAVEKSQRSQRSTESPSN